MESTNILPILFFASLWLKFSSYPEGGDILEVIAVDELLDECDALLVLLLLLGPVQLSVLRQQLK
jgi:hypothetical protein